MKNQIKQLLVALALLALSTIIYQPSTAQAQGTAFTYQGRLNSGGSPANGLYDFRFKLATDPLGNNYIGGDFLTNAIPVANGLFITTIDFGAGIFTGSNYWLEVDVRTNNPGNTLSYTTLTPLQAVTPTPYAVMANSASNLLGALPASQLSGAFPAQLSGTIPLAQLPGAVVTNNEAYVELGSAGIANQLFLPLPVEIYSGGFYFLEADANNNLSLGLFAGDQITSGSDNTAIGFSALNSDTSGSDNVAEGYDALGNNTNDNALVAIGYQALQNDNAYNAGSVSGNGENTAIGYETLQLNTSGAGNTAIGYQALATNTVGYYNTAIGDEALVNCTGGNHNIALGDYAGYYLRGGSNNIYIGNSGVSSESGVIRIGLPGYQTTTYIAGNVGLGGANPQQELSINGGMDVDAAASDNGTVNDNWTLLFGGTTGEGIGSVRVAGYGDSYGLNFYTDFNKRMTILQNGHVGIGTTNATQLLVVGSGGAYCNGTSWVNGSDRNSKQDFASVNPRAVLEKVSALPITEWNYKVEADGIRHIGPMAQDFYAAFGLNGTDDKHISTVDEGGVALAAIQGLNEKLNDKDSEIQTLKQQNDSLAERLSELEATVKQLVAQK